MLKFIARSLGFWLFAGALVAFIYDGAQSIGASTLKVASVGEVWFKSDPSSLNLTQAITERYLIPALWDPVLISIISLPLGIALLILSFFFAYLGRKPRKVSVDLDLR